MIGVELALMLRRRRVWMCWSLLCALPALITGTRFAPAPGQGGAFLSAVVSNGQLFPAAALAIDAAVGGAGAVTSLSGTVLSPAQLGERTVSTVAYLALCMLAIGAIGLFFSTLTDSPPAAALGVLAVVVMSAAPREAADAVERFLPTTHRLAWIDLYRDPILWTAVREGFGVQLAYIAVAFGAAWANFATKDITS